MNKWNEAYEKGRDYAVMNELLLDEIIQKVQGQTALDIGCGTGDLARKLQKRGFKVTAIDGSSVAISKAKEKSANIKYQVVDLANVDAIPDGSFDLITCKLVIAFIENQVALLNSLKKRLSPQGKLCIITPVLEANGEYDNWLNNISVQRESFEQLIGTLFEVELISSDYFDVFGKENTYLLTPKT